MFFQNSICLAGAKVKRISPEKTEEPLVFTKSDTINAECNDQTPMLRVLTSLKNLQIAGLTERQKQ